MRDLNGLLEICNKANAEEKDWKWENMKFKDNYIYVPQCSHLGETLIALDDTYEDSGEDCLFVQTACENFPFLIKRLMEAERLINNILSELYQDDEYLDLLSKFKERIKQFLES